MTISLGGGGATNTFFFQFEKTAASFVRVDFWRFCNNDADNCRSQPHSRLCSPSGVPSCPWIPLYICHPVPKATSPCLTVYHITCSFLNLSGRAEAQHWRVFFLMHYSAVSIWGETMEACWERGLFFGCLWGCYGYLEGLRVRHGTWELGTTYV